MANAFGLDFSNVNDILVFASGVSLSKENRVEEFKREENLLCQQLESNSKKLFIYFSTCSVYDPVERDSQYVAHKLAMEQLVIRKVPRYFIFRVSNVVGKTHNKSTVFKFLAESVRDGQPFNLWLGAVRNFIDVDDVVKLVSYILNERHNFDRVINIANLKSYPVLDIVRIMEIYFNRNANCTMTDAGAFFKIDTKNLESAWQHLGIDSSPNYVNSLLSKYFAL